MWKKYKLSEIGTVVGGATPSTTVERFYGGDIPWLTPKDLSNFQDRYIERGERNITQEGLDSCSAQLLPANSVLFSSRAPIGYVAIAKNPIATNQGFKSIVPNEKVDSLFLYYILRYNKERIEAMGSGTTFKEVSGSVMKDVEISLPSLEEQRRIAGILGAIDDKIENNRRINTNLELQAQALYKQWFVDFDFPNEEGKPYKSSGGKMADSELGPIPDGWRVGLLKDIVNFQSGFPFKSELFSEQGTYRLITIKGVQDGYLDVNGAVYIKNIPDRMPPYCLLTEGDIIMSLTGNVGRCCIVERENLLLNQRVVKLQPTFINSNMFIYTMFRRESFKEKLIALAKGTAQTNLSPIETANMRTITPSASCLVRFNKLGQSIFKQLLKNIKENNRLAAIRDTLLPKLMSGELSVNDVSVD